MHCDARFERFRCLTVHLVEVDARGGRGAGVNPFSFCVREGGGRDILHLKGGRRDTGRKKDSGKPVEDIIREMKRADRASENYREQSLRIHGLICAKCGREFDYKERHLLTVHHKDGNHMNNPPDGSNWENLCIYCHDDEHSRNILGDYLKKRED